MRSRPVHQLGGGLQRQLDIVLLTETEAAQRFRYFDRGCADPVRSFQQLARRKGIPCKFSGRARLYDPRVLEAFMEREGWTLRHKRPVESVPRRVNRSVHVASLGDNSQTV
jgi:hypothetical protein